MQGKETHHPKQEAHAGHGRSGGSDLFLHCILVVFACASLLILSLVIQNPFFLRMPGTTALLLVAASLGVGIVLAVIIRVLEAVLTPFSPWIGSSWILAKSASLVCFALTLVLLILPVTYPEPARNLSVLILVPVLATFAVMFWKHASGETPSRDRLRVRASLALLPFLAAFLLGLSAPRLMGPGRAKVVLIGIDGASWRIIGNLVSRGELPTFARFTREGARGPLESIQPCLSPAVWTSISTGFLPRSHGITNFNGTLNEVKKKGFWEILSEKGFRIGVYRWLVTWPPIEVNGFLVPNWLARDPSTYPPQLSHLKREQGKKGIRKVQDVLLDISYGLTDETLTRILIQKARSALLDLPQIESGISEERLDVIKRRDFFIGLRRLYDPDYTSCVFDGVDAFSHTLWQYMEPEHFENVPEDLVTAYGGAILALYRDIDCYIGEIMETLSDDTYVIVVSDHGFTHAQSLKVHPPKPTKQVLDYIEFSHRELIESSTYQFDRIFLAVKRGEGSSDAARELEEKLLSIAFEGEREPVLSVTRIEKQVRDYEAVFVVKARDGLAFQKDRQVLTPSGKTDFQEIFTLIPAVSGDHDPADGIFFMKGPGVKRGQMMEGLSVLDIHPLILWLYGLEVPQDTDGRLRTDLFEEGSLPAPRFTATYGERVTGKGKDMPLSEEALQRMKALGYIE